MSLKIRTILFAAILVAGCEPKPANTSSQSLEPPPVVTATQPVVVERDRSPSALETALTIHAINSALTPQRDTVVEHHYIYTEHPTPKVTYQPPKPVVSESKSNPVIQKSPDIQRGGFGSTQKSSVTTKSFGSSSFSSKKK